MIQYKYEPEQKRAAAYLDGELIGEATFSPSASMWIIDHTHVDVRARGQRVGNQLIKLLVDEARKAKVKVVPLCPFAKKEFDRNEDYRDLL